MFQKIYKSFILFFLSVQLLHGSLDSTKELNQYSLVHWDLENGLPSNWVVDIHQRKGDPSLWIATPAGLVRFNGVNFDSQHNLGADLLEEGAWALEKDEMGELWVGTKNFGALIIDDKESHTIPGTEGMEVRILHQDRRGRMWIGTPSGLFMIQDDALSRMTFEAGSDAFITAIYEDFANNIWVGTQDSGLFILEHSSPSEFKSVPSEKTIYCIQSDSKNRIWVGGKLGLRVYKDLEQVLRFTKEDGLPSNTVRALQLDSTGCLWIGTENGVIRTVGDQFIADTKGSPFEGVFVTCFYEDQEGSMWIGSKYNGFYQIWAGKFTVFAKDEGLANEVINVVYEDGDSILAGTNSGLYSIRNNQVSQVEEETLGSLRIRDVFRDSMSRLWVCTYSGLYCFTPQGELKIWGIEDGLTSGLVRQIIEDGSGNIWVGTRSGLSRINGDQVKSWNAPELRNELILHIYEDRGGIIWIATDGAGIARFDNETGLFKWFSTEEGLGNNVVFKIHQDLNGIYWLATANGISVFDGENFQNIQKRDGLPGGVVFQVLDDSHGWLWMTSHEGILRIKKASISKFLTGKDSSLLDFQRFGLVDGLKTYQMTGVGESCILNDGSLCLATAKGVALLNRSELSNYLINPYVYFESYEINGTLIEFDPDTQQGISISIGPGVRRLEINYTSSSLVGAKSAMFSTRLEGFDNEQVESSDRKSVFTNLEPGKYLFQAKTKGHDGDWAEEEQSIEIQVEPYFTETKLFYLILLIPLCAMIYLLVWLRTLRLRHQRKKLEEMISQRTSEITEQKQIIEEKNLEIERNNRNLRNSNLELKRLSEEKSNLLGVAAHDIRNPLSNIVALTDELLLRPEIDTNDTKSIVEMVKTSGTDLLGMVQAIVQSVVLENGKLQLNKEHEDFVKIADSVITLNRAAADVKQQRFLMNAPPKLIGFFDPLRIRTALDNYISNAVKYSPPSSVISMEIHAITENGERWAEFKVSDQGPGLTSEDFAHVFGKFSTLSAKPTGNESSTGMGLSIVKQVIESHGGMVAVENNPTIGATFSFRLPLI